MKSFICTFGPVDFSLKFAIAPTPTRETEMQVGITKSLSPRPVLASRSAKTSKNSPSSPLGKVQTPTGSCGPTLGMGCPIMPKLSKLLLGADRRSSVWGRNMIASESSSSVRWKVSAMAT
eukprot:CAMPEP_0194779516 /NCGR_PEP_ID=MMETSP0323_2-20130528/71240_1 /TAXON_ID=2866 ORGANISM="Crypthecodinium cohnii, Strain Seligo" /NCGR_SAMPLE_ID=MMETSP0323_2 /ASSEMBLY_ACC=CAM_ASM_000346 /LENGTH=119 /DNA_ID=CAMNT_0039717191 /DNA_START=340 /DNA_END=696 /DNA_ORIENTATION=-